MSEQTRSYTSAELLAALHMAVSRADWREVAQIAGDLRVFDNKTWVGVGHAAPNEERTASLCYCLYDWWPRSTTRRCERCPNKGTHDWRCDRNTNPQRHAYQFLGGWGDSCLKCHRPYAEHLGPGSLEFLLERRGHPYLPFCTWGQHPTDTCRVCGLTRDVHVR